MRLRSRREFLRVVPAPALAGLAACRRRSGQAGAGTAPLRQRFQVEVGYIPDAQAPLSLPDGGLLVFGSRNVDPDHVLALLYLLDAHGGMRASVEGPVRVAEPPHCVMAASPWGGMYGLDQEGNVYTIRAGGETALLPKGVSQVSTRALVVLPDGTLGACASRSVVGLRPEARDAASMVAWELPVDGGAIFLACSLSGVPHVVTSRRLYCLGQPPDTLWAASLPHSSQADLTFDSSGQAYVGHPEAVVAVGVDGQVLWEYRKRASGPTCVRARPEGGVVCSTAHDLRALDAAGREQWTYALPPDDVLFLPHEVGPDGRVYAPTGRGLTLLTPAGQPQLRAAAVPRGPLSLGAGGELLFRSREAVTVFEPVVA